MARVILTPNDILTRFDLKGFYFQGQREIIRLSSWTIFFRKMSENGLSARKNIKSDILSVINGLKATISDIFSKKIYIHDNQRTNLR